MYLRSSTSALVDKLMAEEPPSFWREFTLSLRREAIKTMRDTSSNFASLATAVGGGLVFVLVFYNVAEGEIESVTDFSSHVGVAFLLLYIGMIPTFTITLGYLDRRAMFEQEYRTGHYGIFSYTLVSIIKEIFLIALQCLIFFVIAFWAVGFQGRFWYMLLIYIVNAFAIANFAVSLSSIHTNVKVAEQMIGLYMFPLMVWCGFYVQIRMIPIWIQWPSWLMPLFYTLRLFLLEEFNFCSHPRGHDQHLLTCVSNLEAIFDFDISYNDESEFTIAQTGLYQGEDSVREYLSLNSPIPKQGDELLHSSCLEEDHFQMLIHDVSEDLCDISVAAVLRGTWSDRVMSAVDMNHRTVYGFRLKYTPQQSVDERVMIHKQHLFWVNPYQNAYPIFDGNKISEDVCRTLWNDCEAKYFEPFNDYEECVSAMSLLPLQEDNIWGENSWKGNSTACRMIHGYMARQNPDIHCPHLSWFSEIDMNGNYKCDAKSLNANYYNWTSDEMDMFRRIGSESDLSNEALAKNVPDLEIGACMVDPKEIIIRTLLELNEFEGLDAQCYSYMQDVNVKAENRALYWGLLFAISVGYRVIGMLFVHHNAVRQD